MNYFIILFGHTSWEIRIISHNFTVVFLRLAKLLCQFVHNSDNDMCIRTSFQQHGFVNLLIASLNVFMLILVIQNKTNKKTANSFVLLQRKFKSYLNRFHFEH